MGHTYTWDADGNMISVDGTTVTMTYDAFDRMVEQTRSSGHTEIAYGPYGMKLALMNGQSLVSAFVKIPGGGRAVYTSTGLTYYRHADHLGSSRLSTKTSKGLRWYQAAYAPYGEDYAQGGDHPDLAFTDENQDTVAGGWATNLYDFMLREYRPAQGRWTSPDPAGLSAVDPTNPQTWNRYAYAGNNPLSVIDPLGLYCMWDDGTYDDNPEDGGASEGDCGSQGGTWINGNSPGATIPVVLGPDGNPIVPGETVTVNSNEGPDPFPSTTGCVSSDPSCLGTPAPSQTSCPSGQSCAPLIVPVSSSEIAYYATRVAQSNVAAQTKAWCDDLAKKVRFHADLAGAGGGGSIFSKLLGEFALVEGAQAAVGDLVHWAACE